MNEENEPVASLSESIPIETPAPISSGPEPTTGIAKTPPKFPLLKLEPKSTSTTVSTPTPLLADPALTPVRIDSVATQTPALALLEPGQADSLGMDQSSVTSGVPNV